MDIDKNQKEKYLAILHPELMSREALLHKLKQRKIEEPGQQSMEKEQLVNLFYKTVVPMPQRKYRLNRKGKIMTKRQILLAKRKRAYNEANAPNSETTTEVISIYSRGQERENRLLSSFNLPGSSVAGDRLKPPPGASGGERKIIRLKSKSESTSASLMATVSSTSDISDKPSSNLTKIVPNKEGRNTSISKPIKIKRHNFDTKPEETIDKTANDIVSSTTDMKTDASNSRSDQKKEKKKEDANEEPVVKKFKKISITWP